MRSVKLLELVILALFGWMLVAFTNAHGQQLNDFGLKALQVSSADVPAEVPAAQIPTVNLDVIYADSCYQFFHPIVSYGNGRIIEIRPYATVTPGNCLARVRNLAKSVVLKTLQQGQYTVRVLSVNHDPIERPMVIQ